jgi:glutamate 5-kinase
MRRSTLVVKVGTSTLTRGGEDLDDSMMQELAEQIAKVRLAGCSVILVSSGAVVAGRRRLALPDGRKDVATKQVLASIGQSVLMHAYEQLFRPFDITVAQTLLTRRDLADRQGYLNTRNTLLALLDLNVLPIVNENDVTAVDELRVGDNDNLSAMVANLIDADLLVILTDTGGLYTADPRSHPDAKLIQDVYDVDNGLEKAAGLTRSQQGTGGMHTKLQAARGSMRWGTKMVICQGTLPNVLTRLIEGEALGTTFHPAKTGLESRKRWLASGLASKGELALDVGAIVALTERGRSLLPAGIKGVQGRFKRGEAVHMRASNGKVIACGLTSYDSTDIARIAGRRSDEIEAVLGYTYGPEVVHRNNLVLLERTAIGKRA